jgi:hypothetical protein
VHSLDIVIFIKPINVVCTSLVILFLTRWFFQFSSLHSNAGARLRDEIKLYYAIVFDFFVTLVVFDFFETCSL